MSEKRFKNCPRCDKHLSISNMAFCHNCNEGWYPKDSLIHKPEIIKDEIIGTIDKYYCPTRQKYTTAFVREKIERLVVEKIDYTYYFLNAENVILINLFTLDMDKDLLKLNIEMKKEISNNLNLYLKKELKKRNY